MSPYQSGLFLRALVRKKIAGTPSAQKDTLVLGRRLADTAAAGLSPMRSDDAACTALPAVDPHQLPGDCPCAAAAKLVPQSISWSLGLIVCSWPSSAKALAGSTLNSEATSVLVLCHSLANDQAVVFENQPSDSLPSRLLVDLLRCCWPSSAIVRVRSFFP